MNLEKSVSTVSDTWFEITPGKRIVLEDVMGPVTDGGVTAKSLLLTDIEISYRLLTSHLPPPS